ncbi:mediator of RNA polymerase II transcription subunit 11-like [Antedon mediterranea]|uniref:mediator of RNA polymerase II transcription subunit 11-like n=1 Tax=Antedon mediterranea TaxID=105859 RepID=UPI003AF954DA
MDDSYERLQKLVSIEKDIAGIVHHAGQAVLELSKDKPIATNAENESKHFLKMLKDVENKLTEQIAYLGQVASGQPHEGSSYLLQKDALMAHHRLRYTTTKLNELQKTCAS